MNHRIQRYSFYHANDFFRKKSAMVVGLLLGVIIIVSNSNAATSPSDVVLTYCNFDSQGSRLSGKGYDKISSLMDERGDVEEPGWDCFLIVRKYSIIQESVVGDIAFVDVKYSVVGKYCVGGDINSNQSEEIFSFKLKLDQGVWKIENYPQFPRLSIDASIATVEMIDGKKNVGKLKKTLLVTDSHSETGSDK